MRSCGALVLMALTAAWAREGDSCPEECRCAWPDAQSGPEVICDRGGLMDDRQFARLASRLPSNVEILWIVGPAKRPNNFSMSSEFSRFTRMRELRLVRCGLRTLGKRVFERLRTLRHLQLEDNDIGHLTAEAFDNTDHLRSLVLRNNGLALDSLATGSFAFLRQLRYLDLSANGKRSRFASNVFSGLANLQTLLLDNVPIFKGDFKAFQDLPALEVLVLSGCQLEAVPRGAFASNVRLKELDVSRNSLDWLDVDAVLGALPNLESLKLSGNGKLNDFAKAHGVLAKATRLSSVHLAGSNFSSLKERDLATVFNNTRLTEVNLCGNDLRHFSSAMLAHSAETVRRLDLCNNAIVHIDNATTSKMGHLRHLVLAENRLRALPSRLPVEFAALQVLNLSANALSLFNVDQLKALRSLRVLDLSKCKFSQLPAHFARLMPKLDEVYLHDNPWNCRCEIGTLRELLLSNRPRLHKSQVQCISPKDVQGLSVMQVDHQALCLPGAGRASSLTDGQSSAMLIIIVGMCLILLLVNVTIVAMCVYNRPSGTYKTHEGKANAPNLKSKDSAVALL